jgi:hypothetical protein
MATILDIADELAQLIEPDPTLRDDSRVRPASVDPDMLYLWPARTLYATDDTSGRADVLRFEVHALWAADRLGEGDPDRSVTEAVLERMAEVAAVLVANPGGETYEQLGGVSFDLESPRGFDVRGFELVAVGYTKEV